MRISDWVDGVRLVMVLFMIMIVKTSLKSKLFYSLNNSFEAQRKINQGRKEQMD